MPEKMKALWRGEYEELEGGGRRPLAYVEGVPARNLTQEEFDALGPEQQDNVRKSGLYEVRTEAQMKGKEDS